MPRDSHMRTLIYKRTHPGDPDASGCFGIHDCMGQVRAWDFDSVIGVGGFGAEPTAHGLEGKVNWIGVGAQKHLRSGGRGPLVTFKRFVLYEDEGPEFAGLAPKLAQRLYERKARVLLHSANTLELREIRRVLALAAGAPPSSQIAEQRASGSGIHLRGSNCGCRKCSALRSGPGKSRGC
jgi:hypothetical protein